MNSARQPGNSVQTMNRRGFLRASGLAASGVLVGGGSPRLKASAGTDLTGKILGVSTLDPADGRTEASKIVELDLVSGDTRYVELPDHRFGHSLVALPDGGFLAVPYGDDEVNCLFLDNKYQPVSELKAPAGHGFGGHAVLLPDQRHIFGHFNPASYEDKREPDQTGQYFVVDVQTGDVVKSAGTNILHGHDVLLTRDKQRVVVGDDGTLETRTGERLKDAGSPFALLPGNPQLVTFNSKTLALQKSVGLDINGAIVHIEEGAAGEIIGAVEQFVANSDAGYAALAKLLGEDTERYVAALDESIVKLGVELPFPGPIVSVNLDSETVTTTLSHTHQMPFDIMRNQYSGKVFNVFTASHMLSRYDTLRSRWGYFHTQAYGIKQPYGLTDIPGTNLMAVNGFMDGIAVFDVHTMALVQKFETNNFGIKHLQYVA